MTKKIKELTTKQQRFVDFFDGNATDAARKAGYKHPMQVGEQNLRKLEIAKAIKSREQKRNKSTIASREERQEFWTDILRGKIAGLDRLKASELLGRSEADFTDKHLVEGKSIQVTIKQYGYKSDTAK